MEIFAKIKLKIFFHNRGLWSTLASARNEHYDLPLAWKIVNVEHQVLEMISSEKSPCRSNSEEDEITYNYDECRFSSARKDAIKEVGCTSLFCGMENNDEICKDQQKAKQGT